MEISRDDVASIVDAMYGWAKHYVETGNFPMEVIADHIWGYLGRQNETKFNDKP